LKPCRHKGDAREKDVTNFSLHQGGREPEEKSTREIWSRKFYQPLAHALEGEGSIERKVGLRKRKPQENKELRPPRTLVRRSGKDKREFRVSFFSHVSLTQKQKKETNYD